MAEAERADQGLQHKRAVASEREAAATTAAHERERADAREAQTAAELACAKDDAARLRVEFDQRREEQEHAVAQIRREREAEARTHNLPWVS